MRNLNLGLSAAQKAVRKIGGSAAGKIMRGDPAELIALWEELRGVREPENLDDILAVQMGSWTEELNRFWFEKNTGRDITNEGESRAHPGHDFMTATLDGLTTTAAGNPAVFEAKHVGGFEPIETVVQRYMPQLHHSMAVTGLGWAVLSVFVGTRDWQMFEIQCDDFYLAQLIDRERAFWRCVETGEPPAAMQDVAPPAMPTQFRTVDMSSSNAWAVFAADWLTNLPHAKTFDKAAKEIKALVEPDVGTATGHGISVTRSKAGALTIKAVKEPKAVKEAA
jgi:predicted phage-related endonuclease